MRRPPAARAGRLVCAVAASALAGCGGGEDEDEPPPPAVATPVQSIRPAPIRPPVAPGDKSPLTTYTHVEERMTTDAERATIRHQFRDGDFVQDADGQNRDPFRSFLLDGLPDQRSGNNGSEGTPTCSAKQMVATSYSIRDLKLVGIVSRGLKRYALMQDSANFGQIVTRGDCIGKEKALVKEIGAGYMTLAVMPEVVAAGVPPVAQERSIPLYPEELPMTRSSDDDDGDAVMPPVVLPSTPPATRPAPPSPTGSPAAPPPAPSPTAKSAPGAPPPARK